jgi:hypothetical protein
MKTQANAPVMRRMAKTYREFGDVDQAHGRETAAAVAHTAADALEDLADTRDDLRDALDAWERWVEQEHRRDPDWPGYDAATSKIAELRTKHFVIGNG